MIRFASALWLFALSFAAPNFASACDYLAPPLDGLQVKTAELANRMVAEAAFVEIVTVQSTAPFSLDEQWRDAWERELSEPRYTSLLARLDRLQFDGGMAHIRWWITFSVVERLKGKGEDQFTWSAYYDDARAPARVSEADGLDQSRFQDPRTFNYSPRSTLLQGLDEGSCSNVIFVQPDSLYLVFRDENGNIVRDLLVVRDRDRLQNWTFENLPTFEPVSEGDTWLNAVRAAARQ